MASKQERSDRVPVLWFLDRIALAFTAHLGGKWWELARIEFDGHAVDSYHSPKCTKAHSKR
jgi:hypothetical protein